jgi:hypothetical protein
MVSPYIASAFNFIDFDDNQAEKGYQAELECNGCMTRTYSTIDDDRLEGAQAGSEIHLWQQRQLPQGLPQAILH